MTTLKMKSATELELEKKAVEVLGICPDSLATLDEKERIALLALVECITWSKCSENLSLHPSECFGLSAREEEHTKQEKRCTPINDYHVFCPTCKKHFYSSSKFNDINSFFQPHLNSANHIWAVKMFGFNETKPMFTWNKWLVTGTCSICGDSNVEAFIIDTDLDVREIMKRHCESLRHVEKVAANVCRTVEHFLPTLDLFAKLCVRKLSACESICKLCKVRIIGGESVVNCHLGSKKHCHLFTKFMCSRYECTRADLVREFMLFRILFDVVNEEVKIEEPVELWATEDCRDYNTEIDPNTDEERRKWEGIMLRDLGFCPAVLERQCSTYDDDFYWESSCMLCNENIPPSNRGVEKVMHFASNTHKLRKVIFNQSNFLTFEANSIYTKNRNARLIRMGKEMEKYEKFKARLKEMNLNIGVTFLPEYEHIDLKMDPVEKVNESKETEKKKKGSSKKKKDAETGSKKGKKSLRPYGDDPFSVPFEAFEKTNLNIFKLLSQRRLHTVKINMIVNDVNISKIMNDLIDDYFVPRPTKTECFECDNCGLNVKSEDRFKHLLKDFGIIEGGDDDEQLEKLLLHDNDFRKMIKRWTVWNASIMICLGCCIFLMSPKSFFTHVVSPSHFKNYKLLKDNEVELIPLTEFWINGNSGSLMCNNCNQTISSLRRDDSNHFFELRDAIKGHHPCEPSLENTPKPDPEEDLVEVEVDEVYEIAEVDEADEADETIQCDCDAEATPTEPMPTSGEKVEEVSEAPPLEQKATEEEGKKEEAIDKGLSEGDGAPATPSEEAEELKDGTEGAGGKSPSLDQPVEEGNDGNIFKSVDTFLRYLWGGLHRHCDKPLKPPLQEPEEVQVDESESKSEVSSEATEDAKDEKKSQGDSKEVAPPSPRPAEVEKPVVQPAVESKGNEETAAKSSKDEKNVSSKESDCEETEGKSAKDEKNAASKEPDCDETEAKSAKDEKNAKSKEPDCEETEAKSAKDEKNAESKEPDCEETEAKSAKDEKNAESKEPDCEETEGKSAKDEKNAKSKEPDYEETEAKSAKDEKNVSSKEPDCEETEAKSAKDEKNAASKEPDCEETEAKSAKDEKNAASKEPDCEETEGKSSEDEKNAESKEADSLHADWRTQGGHLELLRCKSIFTKSLECLLTSHASSAEMYLCAMCLANEPSRLVRDHISSLEHLANESLVLSLCSNAFQTVLCMPCKTIILCTGDTIHLHLNSAYHINAEKRLTGKEMQQRMHYKTINFLVVKGLPFGLPNKTGNLSHLLRGLGTIEHIRSKPSKTYVGFKEIGVADEIAQLRKLCIGNLKLKFSLEKCYDSFRSTMKSGTIFCLGHYNYFVNLIAELTAFADMHRLSLEEQTKEMLVCQSLTNILSPDLFIKCYRFGSRATGLALGSSDLDLFVDCGGFYFSQEEQDRNLQRHIVGKVARILKKSTEFNMVVPIPGSRVPIVTCHHLATNISCDLSFINGLSCENTNLVKFMLSLDDRVRRVILFLKQWIKWNNLHGRPLFSSYALTMLVFYYLQQGPKPVLPTVLHLQKCYKGPPKKIVHWVVGFSMNKEDIPPTKNFDSVPDLILGFFNFCARFNFHDNIVSPLTGKPLKRQNLRDIDKNGLPLPYSMFASEIQPSNFLLDPICIMDPFDLNHNLTKCFPLRSFRSFVYFCRISASLLSNSLKSKSFDHFY